MKQRLSSYALTTAVLSTLWTFMYAQEKNPVTYIDLKNGRSLVGWLKSQTPDSVVLNTRHGEFRLARTDIKSMETEEEKREPVHEPEQTVVNGIPEVAAPTPNVQLGSTDTARDKEAFATDQLTDTTSIADTIVSWEQDSIGAETSSYGQSEGDSAHDGGLNVAWRYETDDEIVHQEMTPFGTLLVSTSSRTIALNPATGEILWSSDDLGDFGMFERRGLFGKRYATNVFHCRFQDRDGYTVYKLGAVILLTSSGRNKQNEHIVAFDLVNGVPFWDSDSAGFRIAKGAWEIRGDSGLLLFWHAGPSAFTTVNAVNIVTGELLWTTKIPLVAGRIDNFAGRGIQFVLGKGVGNKKTVAAIDLHNGEVIFVSAELGEPFDEDKKHLLTLSGYTISSSQDTDLRTMHGYSLEVLHTDDDVMTAFDAQTGEIKWATRKIPLGSWVYDSSSVYVAGDGKVFAVSLKNGKIRWSIKREAERLTITNHGLLLGCDRFECQGEIMLVDPKDGHPLWPKHIDLEDQIASSLWKEDSIYLALPTGFDRISIPTGDHNQVATFQLEGRERPVLSQGFERPPIIAEFKGGIVLSDNQNVLMVGTDGTIRFHEYYPAPGLSFGDIALRIGGALAMTALSYAAATVSAQSQAHQMGQISALSGGSGRGVGIAFYQVYYPALTERSASGLRLPNEIYFYTDRPDSGGREGFSLVRFNLDRGQETARVWIDERRPEFLIDPIDSLVILKRESDEGTALARQERVLVAVKIQP